MTEDLDLLEEYSRSMDLAAQEAVAKADAAMVVAVVGGGRTCGKGVAKALSDNGITIAQIEECKRVLDEAAVPPGVRYAVLPDGTVVRIDDATASLVSAVGRHIEEQDPKAGNPERNWLAFRKQYGRRR